MDKIKWLTSLTPSQTLKAGMLIIIATEFSIIMEMAVSHDNYRTKKENEIIKIQIDRAQERIDFYTKLIIKINAIEDDQKRRQLNIDTLKTIK